MSNAEHTDFLNSMGHHCHHNPSMSQLRWHSHEQVLPRHGRSPDQSWLCPDHEHVRLSLGGPCEFPAILIAPRWYTAAEQPLRLEAYYCTNGIATMFGGLIGYAVGHIESGLAKWMYVFLIFGACSITAGIWALIVLPDLPSTASFLNERERAVAVERVAGNKQGVKNHHFKKDQVWQTFKDPKTALLFIMAVGAQVCLHP